MTSSMQGGFLRDDTTKALILAPPPSFEQNDSASPASTTALQTLDSYGLSNTLDIHWFPANPVGTSGGSALAIHMYRDPGAGQAGFILDNTDAGASIKIKNTQGSNNPNGWGRGNILEIFGFTGATAHGTSDGSITNGAAILTSASGTFTAQDVGKPIRVPGAGPAAGNLDTTILSRQSATQVTLAANASTTVTTANYIYPQVGNVNQMLKVTGNPPGFGNISSITGTPNTGALRFINTTDGLTNLSAGPISFETNSGQCTALQVVQPGGSQTALLVNSTSSGNPFVIQQSSHNALIVNTDGAITRVGDITLKGVNAGNTAFDANLILGTTTGTKIGTATTQKLAFYNATPIVSRPLLRRQLTRRRRRRWRTASARRSSTWACGHERDPGP
jgi:hypothetical protein